MVNLHFCAAADVAVRGGVAVGDVDLVGGASGNRFPGKVDLAGFVAEGGHESFRRKLNPGGSAGFFDCETAGEDFSGIAFAAFLHVEAEASQGIGVLK